MDENGTTPLHRAVTANQIDAVSHLLEHPRLNINEKDLESGWTALHR
jgi:ankyrin repeat protein